MPLQDSGLRRRVGHSRVSELEAWYLHGYRVGTALGVAALPLSCEPVRLHVCAHPQRLQPSIHTHTSHARIWMVKLRRPPPDALFSQSMCGFHAENCRGSSTEVGHGRDTGMTAPATREGMMMACSLTWRSTA
eukprot:3643350-Rhodomonas_salina.2